MARFDSAGAGFSRGFATGRQIQIAKGELQRRKTSEQADRFATLVENAENSAVEAFDSGMEILTQVAPQADADDENFLALQQSILAPIIQHGNFLEQQRARAAAMGAPPAVMANIPSGRDFVLQHRNRLQAALQGAVFQTPELEGEAASDEAVAKAESTLGRPLTAAEKQQLAGVAPSGTTINLPGDEQESQFFKTLGEADANRLEAIETSAETSRQNLVNIQRIKASLESGKFEPGTLADARVVLSRFMKFVGIPDDSKAFDLVGDAATADTLDAASKELAIELAGELSRVTNLSLTLVKDALPSLTRTKEGNEILAEVMERVAERNIEIAKMSRQFRTKGTLTPDGEPSLFEMRDELDESDPIIDEELTQRILGAAKDAPKSFAEVIGDQLSETSVNGIADDIEAGTVLSREMFDEMSKANLTALFNELKRRGVDPSTIEVK